MRASAKAGVLSLLVALITSTTLSGCSSVRDFISHPLGGGNASGRSAQRIAILPFAYRGAEDRRVCDVCPNELVMAQTSVSDAGLATSMFYEQLARYPRFSVVSEQTVARYEAATMDETIRRLTEAERVDAVVVGALLELRPRIGDPRRPERLGGASVYAVALDIGTGQPSWVELFDGTRQPPVRVWLEAERLIGLKDHDRYPTAYEILEYGVRQLAESLDGRVR